MKTSLTLLLLTACLASAATEEKIEKTFTPAPQGTIVVDVDYGSIEVIAEAARSEVSVEGWRKITRWNTSDEETYFKENPIEFTQDGPVITVHARSKQKLSLSWFGHYRDRNEAHYTVRVPAGFSAKLQTAGGSIAVSGLTGTVQADTSGGALHLADIQGTVDVRTSGGSITIKNIQGRISGHTSGGSIHATFLSPIHDDIDLSTSGGGIHLKVAANSAFTLNAETSGGHVSSDLPVTVQGDMGRHHLKGTVNSGGPNVRLHTSGGSIHVEKI